MVLFNFKGHHAGTISTGESFTSFQKVAEQIGPQGRRCRAREGHTAGTAEAGSGWAAYNERRREHDAPASQLLKSVLMRLHVRFLAPSGHSAPEVQGDGSKNLRGEEHDHHSAQRTELAGGGSGYDPYSKTERPNPLPPNHISVSN